MATNTKLAPWRQYSEHDVLNMCAYSGTLPVTAGTVVTFVGSGWRSDEADTQFLESVGKAYNNILSFRYGTRPRVRDAATGDPVAGILLYDVREVDENGLNYKFQPQKAAENNHIRSGETVPILTKGFVLISGVFNGGIRAGDMAYPSGAGIITNSGINQTPASTLGKFFGAPDSNGFALLHVNVQ